MNALSLDVETTISNNGNPFDRTNKLVCIGIGDRIFYEEEFNEAKEFFYSLVEGTIFIGVNIKFDLHWLVNVGFDISSIKIWDCQIGEFLLSNQTMPYPSLDGMAEKYSLGKKLDIVKIEYWEKGIDTDKIPREILSDYLMQDLTLTEQVFKKQLPLLKEQGKYNLFRLQCADLLVLQEMEYNGIYFNKEQSKKNAEELAIKLEILYKKITSNYPSVPINLNSTDDVSCLLYGGTIKIDDRIPIGLYKSGQKIGHIRYKKIVKEFPLPRLIEPLPGSELQKEGYWSTDETTLRSLKPNKEVKQLLSLLKEYSELEKLKGTYFEGYPKLMEKMNWPDNMLHGTLNQCVARTGRLSSSKPNLQNADGETKKLMESRYG